MSYIQRDIQRVFTCKLSSCSSSTVNQGLHLWGQMQLWLHVLILLETVESDSTGWFNKERLTVNSGIWSHWLRWLEEDDGIDTHSCLADKYSVCVDPPEPARQPINPLLSFPPPQPAYEAAHFWSNTEADWPDCVGYLYMIISAENWWLHHHPLCSKGIRRIRMNPDRKENVINKSKNNCAWAAVEAHSYIFIMYMNPAATLYAELQQAIIN